MPIGVCRPLFTSSYRFGRVMKWRWCGQISSPSWQLQALWKLGIIIKNSVRSSSLVEGKMGSKEITHGLKGIYGNPKGSVQTPKGDYNRAL